MTDTIPFQQLTTTGRLTDSDPNAGKVFYTYNADMSGAFDKELDINVLNTGKVFGTVRSLFLDNGSNPSAIEVYISGTDQYFTCPAFGQGFFTVSANVQSNIRLVSTGGATDVVTVGFYNYQMPPVVWYSYGPTNLAAPVKVYGPMAAGALIAAQAANTPVYVGGKSPTGTFLPVSLDATGAMNIAGSVNLSGAITIADGGDVAQGSTTDAAVTNPASNATAIALFKGLLSGIGAQTDANSTGIGNGSVIAKLKGLNGSFGQTGDAVVTNPATSATLLSYIKGFLTGLGQVADAAVTNPASSGSQIALAKGQLTGIGQVADAAVTNPASNASIIAALKGILTGINNLFSWQTSATGTAATVASTGADQTVLASNANRKGATVVNDGTITGYLLLSNAVSSATNFTVAVPGGGYYEAPYGYTGVIKGIMASGNWRVSEFT